MKPERNSARSLVAILCVITLVPGDILAYTPQQPSSPAPKPAGDSAKIPPEQLDSLVAPIALYPDPLLAQVLAASTYPLEIVMLQRWLEKNKNLKDKELADAVAKQTWDPSIKALVALPEIVKRLGDDIQWTADLGNAFLAQQSDVMDAVQRMRKKAQDKGSLKTTEQQKVETKVIEQKTVIVIEQANPQVVYVPSYNPVVVYGPRVLSLSSDLLSAMGPLRRGRSDFLRCWCDDGSRLERRYGAAAGAAIMCTSTTTAIFNVNRNTNIDRGNRVSNQPSRSGNLGGDRTNWTHNPEHRGGTPYRDRATADRFGGSARGDSISQTTGQSQQRIDRQGRESGQHRASGGGRQSGGCCRGQRPLRQREVRRSRSHRQPRSIAQRWRKSGCVRRRFQRIRRNERAQ